MKRIIISLFAATLLGFSALARADSNPSNDSVGLRISITPNFERGIVIDAVHAQNLADLGQRLGVPAPFGQGRRSE